MKGNVLVLGNSGVGKSTLINAVVGKDVAPTGFGTTGTTQRLEIYGLKNDDVPFCLIDSVGFEPDWFKARQAINAVKKWSKESAKDGGEAQQINVVWFCVDGCAAKLFPKAIENLSRSISMWKDIPVIVVITKSYAIPDREKNIEMVHNAFAKMTNYSCNVKAVIPVVAQIYTLNDTSYAAPDCIPELIDKTLELMPEGKRVASNIVNQFRISRKRALAQSIIGGATVAAATVGAVPIPFPDAAILVPLETTELTALSQIYGFGKDKNKDVFITTTVEIGGVSAAAKAIISCLKAIPGITIAASVLNAIVAGTMVAAIGEASCYIYEQIYLGEKSFDDVAWIKNVLEDKLSTAELTKVVESITKSVTSSDSSKKIAGTINGSFRKRNKTD